MSAIRNIIFNLVDEERLRQNELKKIDKHPFAAWYMIVSDYFGEVARTLLDLTFDKPDSSYDDVFRAVLKVVALGVAWLEDIIDTVPLGIDLIVSEIYGEENKNKTEGK